MQRVAADEGYDVTVWLICPWPGLAGGSLAVRARAPIAGAPGVRAIGTHVASGT
jgi:hypothetical protein